MKEGTSLVFGVLLCNWWYGLLASLDLNGSLLLGRREAMMNESQVQTLHGLPAASSVLLV